MSKQPKEELWKNISWDKVMLKGFMLICLWAISWILIGQDTLEVIKWWALMFVMGIGVMPLSARLLKNLCDGGYLISRIVGVAVSGFLTWLLCYGGLPFTTQSCILVTVAVFACCWGIWGILFVKKKAENPFKGMRFSLCFAEEMIFAGFLVLWCYLIGFKPEAYGTEKMMDYGFMMSMMKSTVLPAKDMWYSEGIINYYYGGQYYCTFLTKLFFSEVSLSYNILRAMIASIGFAVPFNLVVTMLGNTCCAGTTKEDKCWKYGGGVLGGAALSLAGNMHYVLYCWIIPTVQDLFGIAKTSYWFPDSTRYIGYNPDVADKTIHEFPSYSFILGDMHAHVINIMFVLPMLALLLSWSIRKSRKVWEPERKWSAWTILKEIVQPEMILMTLFIGIYQWTNYWDYPIYFGAAGLVILFTNIRTYNQKVPVVSLVTAGQAVLALGLSSLLIYPFTKDFDSIFQGVALAKNHTVFYQLMVLWGLPVLTILIYYLAMEMQRNAEKQNKKIKMVPQRHIVDLYMMIIGIYGIVLLAVPEIMYVKDIYGEAYARSNTMFKFTHQAYMMLAICMSYGIVQLLRWKGVHQIAFRRAGVVSLVLVICTCGYFGTSVRMWFGNVWNLSGYQGLDATAYIERDFSENAGAIRWVEENTNQEDVVLEANGDSYSSYAMVSAMTGTPTVLGWYVHEWLWRNSPEDLNAKSADIQTIYTASDVNIVKETIEQYHISYVFVGTNEWEKYGNINLEALEELCTLVYVENDSVGENGQPTRVYQVNK